MRTFVRFVASLLLCLVSWQAQAFIGITLTPNGNGNGGGNIPGSCATIDFYTLDGDWAPTLTLPETSWAGAVVTIHANATYSSNLVLTNTDLPLRSTILNTGDTLRFTFDAGRKLWLATLPESSPNSVGAAMPAGTKKLSRYVLSDGNWAPTVTLPATALPGAVLIVQSAATWGASIAPANVLHASTMRLATGEKYAFMFHPDLKKWYITSSPVAQADPKQAVAGGLPATTRPRTELVLPAGLGATSFRLPASAGDRDRLRVSSLSAAVHTIRNDGIDFAGTLAIAQGDAYDFMWIADKQRWTLMSSPSRSHAAQSLSTGKLPPMNSPTAKVYAADGNWQPSLALPSGAKPGDRVLVTSAATWSFDMVRGAAPANFATQRIDTGDTVAFIVNAAGQWTVETRNIAMLNVYADKVVAAYGQQGARARQLESFRLTNEALENSRANFRLKMVGLMQHRDQGATLNDAVMRLPGDAVVQNERVRLKADAVYYEGAEDGCGLAWVNSSAYYMVATGSINCGTTVMRHEFGHNMGLSHGGTAGASAPYATGYSLLGTVMGGNGIPYYSTPLIYDATLGIPMGVANQIDETRAMNERSQQVANFHR